MSRLVTGLMTKFKIDAVMAMVSAALDNGLSVEVTTNPAIVAKRSRNIKTIREKIKKALREQSFTYVMFHRTDVTPVGECGSAWALFMGLVPLGQ